MVLEAKSHVQKSTNYFEAQRLRIFEYITREKTRFVWIFLINISVRLAIYLSVCPFVCRGYRSQSWADFNN